MEPQQEQSDGQQDKVEVEVSPGVSIVDSNPEEGEALASDVRFAEQNQTDDQDNPRVVVG